MYNANNVIMYIQINRFFLNYSVNRDSRINIDHGPNMCPN